MRIRIRWIDGYAHASGTGPDGRRIRKSLKTRDPRQAEEARAALEARLWKIGTYGADAVVTFDECAVAYAEDGGEARFLPQIAAHLAGRLLKSITPRDVRAAARAAYPDAGPATWNRQGITPARAVINYGHQQGWCGAIRVRQFPSERPRRQAVGRDYLDQLRPHIPDRLHALLLFCHTTGRRVGEALALVPDDLDMRAMTAAIPVTKNGEPAVAHLTAEVAQLIATLEPRHGRVFGYCARSSLYPSLRRGCRKAGLPYLGTHQIGRHSFATTLDAAGWNPKAIADAGGWKSVRLVQETYVHPKGPAEAARDLFGKNLASGSEK